MVGCSYCLLNRMTPPLSTITTARLAVPRCSFHNPYDLIMAPGGWRSERRGKGTFPKLVAHIWWENWLSVLMPRTWAPFSPNWPSARPKEEVWVAQRPVKSKTWNTKTTCFSPLYWLNVTRSPMLEGRSKSGAGCPTSPAIRVPPLQICPLIGGENHYNLWGREVLPFDES